MYKRAVVLFVLGLIAILTGETLILVLGVGLVAVGGVDVGVTMKRQREQRLDTAWGLTAELLDGSYFPVDETSMEGSARHVTATVDGVMVDIQHELASEEPYTLASATVAAPPGWWRFLPEENVLMPSTHPLPDSFELRCSEDGVYAVSDKTIDETETLLETSYAVAGLANEAQSYHPWSALAGHVNGRLQHDPVARRWALHLPNGPEDMILEVTPQGNGYRTEARQNVHGSALPFFVLNRRDTLSLAPDTSDVIIGEYVLSGDSAGHWRGRLQVIAPLLRVARPLSLQADHDRVIMTWSHILDHTEALRAARKILRTLAKAHQQSPYRTAAA